jgi:hypothetical protein
MNDNVRLESKLERLREYLRDWAGCSARWSPAKGFPRSVAYLVDNMKAGVADSSDLRDGPSPWAMGIMDTCINELCKTIPEASAVLLVRYLNKAGPAVYRHGRLQMLTPEETDALGDRAEIELVPMVERKGLPL